MRLQRALLAIAIFVSLIILAQPLLAAQVSLTWRDNSTNEDGFNVQRRLFNDAITTYATVATTGPNTVTYTDSTIAVGAVYCYRVNAFNKGGVSPWSAEACMLATPDGLVMVYTP